MRLARPDTTLEERSLVNSFASWLLDIGDGKSGRPTEEDPENTSWIDIPASYCLTPDEQGLSKLIEFIYDQSTLHTPSAMTLQQKAIMCPKNETANIINSKVLDMVLGEIEHLNTLKLPGFPPHHLELKVGAPVMLLRNVNLAEGLCNGTRMIVRQLMTKLIEVHIIMGKIEGRKLNIKMELSTIAHLTSDSTNKTLEAKVYRKWITKSPPEMTPYAFCCILLDREGIRFTAEATITGINLIRDWDYISYHQCGIPETAQGDSYTCLDHGPQPCPFFSPTADKVADHPCTELVEKYRLVDLKNIPPEILATQGKTGVFQFHLNTLGNLRDLTIDAVFDLKKQDESMGTTAQEPSKGPPSSASAATTQSMENKKKLKEEKKNALQKKKGQHHRAIAQSQTLQKRRKKPR
nr:DNA helicase [Tanacetum cinerariifolium]